MKKLFLILALAIGWERLLLKKHQCKKYRQNLLFL